MAFGFCSRIFIVYIMYFYIHVTAVFMHFHMPESHFYNGALTGKGTSAPPSASVIRALYGRGARFALYSLGARFALYGRGARFALYGRRAHNLSCTAGAGGRTFSAVRSGA